jgi:hypothetical protein
MIVMVAALNSTTPHGWRPYHRPACWHLRKPGTREGYWQPTTVAEAEADERRPCMCCGPR